MSDEFTDAPLVEPGARRVQQRAQRFRRAKETGVVVES